MINAYYKIYLNDTIALSRSIIFKSSLIADSFNRLLTDLNLSIPVSKTEWRYYLHLSGTSHYLDDEITVVSLDDGSDILFNKDNLIKHKKTKSLYLSDPDYVKALNAANPLLTVYIQGVLTPVDINTAIAAPEGTVLYYNKNLVAPQEYSLIRRLGEWIGSVFYRTQMDSFFETDNLSAVASLANIYAFITPKLLELRFNVMKTAETCDYHILTYLASHNSLDKYFQYLTLEQKLFLYRNINHIERATGLTSTFNILLDALMTKRNLPVFDYKIRHVDMDLSVGEMLPTPTFIREPLNIDMTIDPNDITNIDLDLVIKKEVPAAVNNPRFLDQAIDEATDAAKYSRYSNLPTKILESSAIDPEDLELFKLSDVLINEWMHLAYSGVFKTTVNIVNPLNGDNIKMSNVEAWTLFMYAVNEGRGQQTYTEVPLCKGIGIIKNKWVPFDEYSSVIPTDRFDRWDADVLFFMGTQHEYTEIIDVENFILTCTEILNYKRYRKSYVMDANRYQHQAIRNLLFNYSYVDRIFDFKQQTYAKYDDLLAYLALDANYMSAELWNDLALDLLDKATGFSSIDTISLKDIQSAMVKLFAQLSSYSIQFIEEIASTDMNITVGKFPIAGDSLTTITTKANSRAKSPKVLSDKLYVKERSKINNSIPIVLGSEVIKPRNYKKNMDISMSVAVHKQQNISIVAPMITVNNFTKV